MYYFYLKKLLLPIAPSKLQLKINGQNKQYNLINDGEINILKKAGLTDIEFDVLLPQVQYPFATYKSGFQGASYYLKELEKLKTKLSSFQFIVTREMPNGKMLFDTNMKVSLESYKIKEEKKNGFDVLVSIKLKQYKSYSTKTCNITFAAAKPQSTVETKRETTNAPAAKTYTVKSGDCLWNIAKMFYGNGSLYTKIHDANRDKVQDANKIYVGQVLTIP